MRRSLFLSGLVTLLLSVSAWAENEQEGIAFFEKKIRPVLVQHCYSCHSADAKSVKGGLLLDTKAGMAAGGDSGAAIVPRNVDESLLLSAVRYDDYEMPPKGQLPDSIIQDFETWVRMGAPDPRTGDAPIRREIDLEAGRQFWAFRPVSDVVVPEVNRTHWPRNDADRFVLARLEEAGLEPVEDADSATWLRRVTFDLIGLPPTTEEVQEFLQDSAPSAKQVVVDRLLSSQHFGERWGRHWLDLARYAESTGRTRNYPYPYAWRYRDYVIQSFNDDKPFDQFVREQLAGDLLNPTDEAQREAQLVATGYLAVGSPDLNERDAKVFQMDMIADQLDTIGKSMLGLTVGCARCHDHKFDPIPTDDYYALAGIFKSTQLLNGYSNRVGGNNKARPDLLIRLSDGDEPAQELTEEEQLVAGLDRKKAERLLKAKADVAAATDRVNKIKKNKTLGKQKQRQQLAAAKKQVAAKTKHFNTLRNRFQRDRKLKFEGDYCLGVKDANKIVDCQVNIRGDTKRLGDKVPRGFLRVATDSDVMIPDDESGRLELANWIVSPANPLTARVFVNRVWQKLFGRGIVRTVDNFGQMGARPTHPELLDFLARQFIAEGWSVKELIRNLVLSRTYGLSVRYSPEQAAADEENTLLWRMNSRRLEFEAIRDAMLAVSGTLQTTPPSGSWVASLNINELSRQKSSFDYPAFEHRSVYVPLLRNLLPDEMNYFDFPDASESRGVRDVTTVPTQSLFMLNSPFVIRLAEITARSVVTETETAEEAAQLLHLRVWGRDGTDNETARLVEYADRRVAELARSKKPSSTKAKRAHREQVWSEIVHAMFASAEFRYR